jgi:lysine 2,3-aminomutase
MTHFNHPRELTAEAAEALEKFVDNGIPVMNQMMKTTLMIAKTT